MWLGLLWACFGCETETETQTPHSTEDTDTATTGDDTGSVGDDTGEPVVLPEPAWRGTWVAQIKDMDPASSAHCQEGGWYRDDVVAMRDALLETNQNVYAGYIDDGDEADCWFLNLEDMLEVVTPEDDLTIFGAMKTGQPLSSYTGAIGALRERAVAHPELSGMLIDDFFFMPQSVFAPGHAFSKEDLAALASAAHDGDLPEIDLWTHIAGHAAGELLIPGVVLGAAHCRAGCAIGSGDESWVEVEATAASDGETFTALLRNNLLGEDALLLQVSLDGVVAYEETLDHGNAYAFRRLVAPLPTVAGAEHTVRVSVTADGAPVADRIELSGFRLGGASVSPSAMGTSREDGLMAEDTSSGHIVDYIDGVLLHFWDDPEMFDIETFRHLFEETCGRLAAADVRCVATMWGNNQWAFTMDRAQTVEKLTAAQELAEGVVVFRYPLDMHGHTEGVPPDEGVYREQLPEDSRYDLMAYWPGYTRGIPGWSHAWESTATCDGTHTLRWEDNDAVTGRFRYALQVNGRTVESVDVGDVAGVTELDVDVASGDVLTLTFSETESVGNISVSMHAAVDPPEGCPALAWSHSAAADPEQAALYDCYASWFRGEAFAQDCR